MARAAATISPTRAVVQRYGQVKPGVVAGQSFRLRQLTRDLSPETGPVAYAAKANPLLMQFRDLGTEIMPQQTGQVRHLLAGPAPVLTAECIQRQPFHTAGNRRLDRAAYRLRAGPVPGHAWQVPRLCPATIAVHDDGNVSGDRRPCLASQRRIGVCRRRLAGNHRPHRHDLPRRKVHIRPA